MQTVDGKGLLNSAPEVSLADLVKKGKEMFKEAQRSFPERDLWLLLEWASGKTRLDFIKNSQLRVPQEHCLCFFQAVERRIAGEPPYRIIGECPFYGLSFLLGPTILEPRADTEILVEAVIRYLKEHLLHSESVAFLDMGTGSGNIAIASLYHVAKARCVAVDTQEATLEIAKKNAQRAGVETRFSLCRSNLFTQVKGHYSLIVSNPPYIPQDHIPQLEKEVRCFDPLIALDGGKDGLSFYRDLAKESGPFLERDGFILLEIGYGQEEAVCKIFENHGYHLVERIPDLQKIIRVLIFQKAQSCL